MTVHATLPILLITFLVSVNALAQHDPGRNAVRLLAREQVEAAVELAGVAPGRRNSAISEAERCFVLAMAACRRKDAAAAFGYAKQAVDKGLPVERL